MRMGFLPCRYWEARAEWADFCKAHGLSHEVAANCFGEYDDLMGWAGLQVTGMM